MGVLHSKLFFLPVDVQHNQCPRRFFNPRRDTQVLWSQSYATRDTTLPRNHHSSSGQCNAMSPYWVRIQLNHSRSLKSNCSSYWESSRPPLGEQKARLFYDFSCPKAPLSTDVACSRDTFLSRTYLCSAQNWLEIPLYRRTVSGTRYVFSAI